MHYFDDFYSRLSWGQPEEIQRAAIEEAGSIQNLWLFIQPMVFPNPKAVWENCAIILAKRTDSELAPYLNQIFEWLQDLSWPGAIIIHNRLLDMEEQMCSEQLSRSQKQAQRENDDEWLFNLKYLQDKIRL